MRRTFMRRVAVIGVGVTKFGLHDRTSAELFADAAGDALTDAGIAASAVQALYYGNVVGGETEHQLHTGPQAASVLGIPSVPTTRFETACASSHAAFRHAVMEIGAGVSDVILVGGAERVLNVSTAESTEYFAYASDAVWEQPLGLTFPGVFALIARAHMEKYGTTEAQMAAVAVKNHRHGALNPKAQFQKHHDRPGAAVRLRRRSAQALRLLSVQRRRRRRRARLRGSRPPPPQAGVGARLGGRLRLDAPRRQARPLAGARDGARGGGGVPTGRPRPHRRGRRRAARLLHDRRDRRHRGARPLRPAGRRPGRREAPPQPRPSGPRQPVRR